MFDNIYNLDMPFKGYMLPLINQNEIGLFNNPFNSFGNFSSMPSLFSMGSTTSFGNLDLDFFSQFDNSLNFNFLNNLFIPKISGKRISSKKVKDLNPKMQIAFKEFSKRAKAEGINFKIVVGFRNNAQQQYLYKTKPKGYAARPGTSLHEKGLAMDLKASHEDLRKLGKIWTDMGYNWGGKWPIHTEIWHFDLKPAKHIKHTK